MLVTEKSDRERNLLEIEPWPADEISTRNKDNVRQVVNAEGHYSSFCNCTVRSSPDAEFIVPTIGEVLYKERVYII